MNFEQPFITLPFKKGDDYLRIRDIVQGTFITGATGSGKTSGSGKSYRKKLLASRAGGLVLCAKAEEAAMWIAEAKKAGREGDIILLGRGSSYYFPVFDQEKESQNIARLIDTAMEMNGKRHHQESFWPDAQRQAVTAAADIITLAKSEVTFQMISEVISSAPHMLDPWQDREWAESSEFAGLYAIAHARFDEMTPLEKQSFDVAVSYWTKQYPLMDERTRANIEAGITAMLDGFLRGVIFQTFSDTDLKPVTPEMTFEGKIIVVNLSYAEYGQAGMIAQGLIKYVWQRACTRRIPKLLTFLYADEVQFFVNQFDREFQSVARQYLCATVYLTQSYSVILDKLGSKAACDALLGNFLIKIGHANADAETNEWFARTVGFEFRRLQSTNFSQQGGASGGLSESRHYRIDPSEFLILEMGGESNHNLVGAYVFKPGVFNENGQSFRHVLFAQGE